MIDERKNTQTTPTRTYYKQGRPLRYYNPNKAGRQLLSYILYLSYILMVVLVGLVGCFGLNGPLRQYFSLCRAVSQREGESREI